MEKKRKSLAHSFGCALQGIAAGIREERNMKIHCCAAAAVLGLGVGRTVFDGVVHLPDSVRDGSGFGVGKLISGIADRPGHPGMGALG